MQGESGSGGCGRERYDVRGHRHSRLSASEERQQERARLAHQIAGPAGVVLEEQHRLEERAQLGRADPDRASGLVEWNGALLLDERQHCAEHVEVALLSECHHVTPLVVASAAR